MTVALLLAAAVTAATLDPCAPLEPSGAPDSATAMEYRSVGDAERAAGRRDSASAAYRAALSRDPGDAAARAGLAALCKGQRDSAFYRGLGLLRGGECAAALPTFEEARLSGDRAAALLEGICLYQLEDDARATALLREAETDAGGQDSARFFLGLIALRDGRADDAAALLDSSAADRRLAPFAQELSRAARRQGKLVLSFMAESGWDSNVDLTPDGPPASSSAADGTAEATAALSFAPLGESGPFARASASWREQLRLDEFDMHAVGASAGWQVGRGRRHALVEYGYDYRDLGGAPYLSAHRLLAEGRVDLAKTWSLGATYTARLESYLSTFSDYSGLRHIGEIDVTADLGRQWTVSAAWRGGRDGTRLSSFSWWEQGPHLSVRKALAPRMRMGLEAAWTWRTYDAADVGSPVRADTYADASALLELDLAERFTLRLAATAREASSNRPDFRYTKIVPTVALAYTFGLM